MKIKEFGKDHFKRKKLLKPISTCPICKKEFEQTYTTSTQLCCSHECDGKRRSLEAKVVVQCKFCGKEFESRKGDTKIFCNQSCVAKDKITRPEIIEKLYSEEAKQKQKESQKKFFESIEGEEWKRRFSEYQKEHTCFLDPEITAKSMATKEKKGILHQWKGERGGNGKLTEPQMILSTALKQISGWWRVELPIPTKRKSPYPTNYKADIGNKRLKIVIEIDGDGHNSQKAKDLDKKKQDLLDSFGWLVLRFTNKAIFDNVDLVINEIICKAKGR